MDFKETLIAVQNSTRNWEDLFLNKEKLLKQFKKKDDGVSKAARKRFKHFLEADGNEILMAVRDRDFDQQKEACRLIAKTMQENYAESDSASYQMAMEFLNVCLKEYEVISRQEQMEKLLAEIFTREIKVDKRLRLLERSENPMELFEVGEIYLKTEDFFNPEKAAHFYEEAAKRGVSDGLLTVGLYYQLDNGQFDKAKEMYEKLLEYGNPKGHSGLAILYLDQNPENPYRDDEKGREEARKGYEKRCGTSMFIDGAIKLEDNPSAAADLLISSRLFDANLANQYHMTHQFLHNVFNNLARNFPMYLRAHQPEAAKIFDNMSLSLFASKYNMTKNFGLFLGGLQMLVKAIQAVPEYASMSEAKILEGLGLNKEVIEQLASQYLIYDDNTKKQLEEVLGAFSGNE